MFVVKIVIAIVLVLVMTIVSIDGGVVDDESVLLSPIVVLLVVAVEWGGAPWRTMEHGYEWSSG